MRWFGRKTADEERALHYDAGVQLASEGKFAEAISELKQASKIGPASCDVYLQLGAALMALERWKEAMSAYNQAKSIDPYALEAYKQLGAIHVHDGNFVEALKVYVIAIGLESKDSELRNDIGIAYFNIGAYNEAIKAFKQSLLITPAANVRAHYYLGLVYIDLKDRMAAKAASASLNEIGRADLAAELQDKIDAEL
jgi:tetratricopeptide (TPR) repeat protein